MPSGDDLLRAILDDPDDDPARLVYADWLQDEGGDPLRGEFIQAHTLLAVNSRKPCQCEDGVTFCQRCRAVAEMSGRVWQILTPESARPCPTCSLHAPLPHGGWSWDYRAGFVERVTAPVNGWIDLGPLLVRAHPVRLVSFVGLAPLRLAQSSGDQAWYWFGPDRRREFPRIPASAAVPAFLFEDMVDGRGLRSKFLQTHVLSFPSRDHAEAAISQTALQWARNSGR